MTEWTFFARILPERIPLSFNFGSMDILAPHSSTKLKIKNLFAHQSQITCKVIVEDGAPNLFLIRNILDDALRSVIDLLGYAQGLHFELDIISATSDTGEIFTFGTEVPVLAQAHAASVGTQQIDGTLVQATLSDIGARTALAALRKAMREALGTGFYCYQGIEAIMQAMRIDGQTDTQAWDRMRDTLKVDRAIVDYVKLHGDDRRHGRTANISEPERIKVFLITDKIIGRYLQFLVTRATLDSASFPAITMADFDRGSPILIFKIVPRAEWEASSGDYHGSAHDRADGFLHFSTGAQLPETLRRYYAGQDDLMLIAVDPAALGDALKWEYSASRGEDFPHLYAPLSCDAMKWARPLKRNADGAFVLPDLR